MSDLLKTERETIRFSKQQARWLSLAAAIESRRTGERVEVGPLLREIGVSEIKRRIIDNATPDQLAQAEADLAAEEAVTG